MKTCFKCQKEKPLSEYYSHPKTADRHLNKCKSCTKSDVSRHYYRPDIYEANKEKERARNKVRTKDGFWKTKKYRDLAKYKARQMVNSRVQSGTLQRGVCEVCGRASAEGHHPDYNKPLEVIWLCLKHHREIHK